MKAYNLYEITDSRILYDKNPPRFMALILLIVTALIVAFLVWSDKTYLADKKGEKVN